MPPYPIPVGLPIARAFEYLDNIEASMESTDSHTTLKMSPLVQWRRLIRYRSQDGDVKLGDPQIKDGDDILALADAGDLKVEICSGLDPIPAQGTGKVEAVKELLAPLMPEDVPFIRCIGLNYKTHILETGRPLPTCPTVFAKPGTAVAGPTEAIPVCFIAQSQCDYEGELTILIGKDAKDISEENALEYVAAYTTGNDISTRDWQREADKAGPIPQWTFSKSFDKYAPLGPCLVSSEHLGAADNLELTVRVNGEIRQQSNTSDLCFGVKKLIAFCSQGQTLQKGSLIMTGTPGGVGLFMKPPQFLQDGDIVTTEIERIGRISNRIQFQ